MKKYNEAYDAIRHIATVNGLLNDTNEQLRKREFDDFNHNLNIMIKAKQEYSSSQVLNEIKKSKTYHKTIKFFCLLWFLNELNQYHVSQNKDSEVSY